MNIRLERRRGVSETKWYNEILEKTVSRLKSGLLLVTLPDSYPVVRVAKIKLGIDLSSAQSF